MHFVFYGSRDQRKRKSERCLSLWLAGWLQSEKASPDARASGRSLSLYMCVCVRACVCFEQSLSHSPHKTESAPKMTLIPNRMRDVWRIHVATFRTSRRRGTYTKRNVATHRHHTLHNIEHTERNCLCVPGSIYIIAHNQANTPL